MVVKIMAIFHARKGEGFFSSPSKHVCGVTKELVFETETVIIKMPCYLSKII